MLDRHQTARARCQLWATIRFVILEFVLVRHTHSNITVPKYLAILEIKNFAKIFKKSPNLDTQVPRSNSKNLSD